MTVLVGANGYGKSSTIQALLLFKQAVDNASYVNLNGDYGLELGEVIDVINQNYSEPQIVLSLTNEGTKENSTECLFDIEDRDEKLTLDCTFPTDNKEEKLEQKEFYYVSAERIGPRISQPLASMEFLSVGTKGERTAQVIATKGGLTKVENDRIFQSSKNPNLDAQVNEWLSYIFPGVKISANIENSLLRASIKVSNTYSKSVHAPNMGFGVSFVLPIIVDGLVAKKGSFFIIENPEAHLHPAAQTAIGYFLATVAHAGVNVIVETHSDHVIDGIQLFVVRNKEWHGHVTINNYGLNTDSEEPLITPITLDENGDYSEWPDGFMDQTQKNYIERSKADK
jgi:predicted ATPase